MSRSGETSDPEDDGTEIPNSVDARVGHFIRERRVELGLSAPRLAEAVGVATARLVEWESGFRRVGADRLRVIAEILAVPLDAFFEDVKSAAPIGSASSVSRDGGARSKTASVDECARLCAAFAAITDAETRDAIMTLVLALTPNANSRH